MPTDPKHYMEFDEDDPRFQVRMLAMRVDALTREKEAMEKKESEMDERIAAMERSFQRGAGIMIALPIIGTIVGFVFAYGKILFGGGK